MKTFDFDPSTRVVFGENQIERLGEFTAEFNATRVLLVTDPGLISAGHADKAQTSLEHAGLTVVLFKGVSENPTSGQVAEGARMAGDEKIDFIVGLGGGSAMDCAKGVNFVLTNGGRMEDYRGFGKAKKPMLRSIGIPTTAGTGSDAQSYALISDSGTHEKMACGDRKARFSLVVLDPTLCDTAPKSVVTASGLDALSHAIESYVSTSRNPVSRMFSREAWRLLQKHLPPVLQRKSTIETWGAMLYAAHMAGLAIEHSMLGAAHACANPLTARFGVTHGIAVSVMLPHVIRFNLKAVNGDYAELGSLLPGNGSANPAERVAEWVVEMMMLSDVSGKLRDHGIDRSELAALAADAQRQWTGKFNPRPVTEKDLKDLYEAAF